MITIRGFSLIPPFPDLSAARMLLRSNTRLFTRHDVPPIFREPYIFTGYRSPRSTVQQCLLSIFDRTNETCNFWTHILPTIYFITLTLSIWQQNNLHSCSVGYPLAVCFVTVCLYPFMSAVAHVFNTMSVKARHLCFFFDYAALSLYSLGVAIAYKAYLFPAELIGSSLYNWYVPIATVNALGCMLFSCQTRFMPQGVLRKVLRVMAFAIPYCFDSLPLLYRMFWSSEAGDDSMAYHRRQFVFAAFGAGFYISHLPERMFPGTFDIVGHSHQLFHVMTAIATRDQVIGLTMDYQARRDFLVSSANHDIPSFTTSIMLILCVLIADLIILTAYTTWMYRSGITVSPCCQNLKGYASDRKNSDVINTKSDVIKIGEFKLEEAGEKDVTMGDGKNVEAVCAGDAAVEDDEKSEEDVEGSTRDSVDKNGDGDCRKRNLPKSKSL